MQNSFRPIFTAPTTFEDGTVTFHTLKNEVRTQAPIELINELIKLCDGNHTLESVIKQLEDSWNRDSLLKLIKTLQEHNVVVDGRNLGDFLWQAAQNPTPIPTDLDDDEISQLVERSTDRHKNGAPEDCSEAYTASTSDVQKLLQNRGSVREFSGESISQQKLVDILWAAYGEVATGEINHRRTVPSGGSLFPLDIGLILFKSTQKLSAGVYNVFLAEPNKVSFSRVSDNLMKARRSFVDPMQVNGAAAVVMINGSFDLPSKKYGNRSIPYVTLEAGHVAQNALLVASEYDLATVEVGGFYESMMSSLQDLSDEFVPLTSIVIGHPSKTDTETPYRSENVDLKWPSPITDEYELPFSMALARMADDEDQSWSSGKAASPDLARTKALVEAREWHACGNVSQPIVHDSLANLESAIDPRDIIRFNPRRYEESNFPLDRFDPNLQHSWVLGTNEINKTEVHVPVDAVYYQNALDGVDYQFLHANTSGVAAHPNRKQALKNSVLELIERDAFMVSYLATLTQPTVRVSTLPDYLQKRIHALEESGFEVWVKDISLGLAPAVLLLAQHKERKITTCSACAGFNPEEIVNHALMELEQSVLSVFKGWPDHEIEPDEVESPHDHGVIYAQEEYYQNANFLVHGGEKKSLSELGLNAASCWDDLVAKFSERDWKLITIPLQVKESAGGNKGLYITRSIVPGIVPIVFGNDLLPTDMERIYSVANEYGKDLTHEDMPSFTHPFA